MMTLNARTNTVRSEPTIAAMSHRATAGAWHRP
jgi:hypothetical protein